MNRIFDENQPNDLKRQFKSTIESLQTIEDLWKKDSQVFLPILNELTNLSHLFIDLIRTKPDDKDFRHAFLQCVRLFSQCQTGKNRLIDIFVISHRPLFSDDNSKELIEQIHDLLMFLETLAKNSSS